jgi:hypothetical protein
MVKTVCNKGIMKAKNSGKELPKIDIGANFL